ncbi:MAG TPA: hypothetical protein VJ728_02580 [Candidatus Binataceae bacterium]|nr:hypothetical protein [Candidatus Binataceae bacterium]
MSEFEKFASVSELARFVASRHRPTGISPRIFRSQSAGPRQSVHALVLIGGQVMLVVQMGSKTTKSLAAQQALDGLTAEVAIDLSSGLEKSV